MGRFRSWSSLVGVLATILFLVGCGSAMDSVRAWRQHGQEPSDIGVLTDRLDDLAASLELVQRLLFETKYTPGAPWIGQLGLTNERAEQIRAELQNSGPYANPQFRVPIARIYREHIRQVLASAKTTRASGDEHILAALKQGLATGSVTGAWKKTRSIQRAIVKLQKAIAQVDARLKLAKKKARAKLKARIKGLQKRARKLEDKLASAGEAAQAELSAAQFTAPATAAARQVYQDLVAIVSVAARLEAEALALAPVIVTQLIRVPRGNAASLARAARKATLTVSNIKSLGIRLRQQVKIIFTLADKLCDVGGLSLSETPGFALSESAADSIKGFALDSLYFDMRAGGEMFFFHAQELDEKKLEDGKDGVTYDLTGRQNRLNYKVKPIVLASFKLDGGIDLMGIPGFINFDLGYKTDRVYRSGGSVESDSGQELLKDLNASGLVSDALSVGAAVLGIRAAFKKAVFNSGQVEVIDDATGAVLARGPLRLDLTQFDLTYDLTWAIDSEKFKKLFDELAVGFRYLNYKLPRILYEFVDGNGDPDKDEYVYTRESPVQSVESEYFLIGAQGHRAHPVSERLKVLFDLGIHFGGGPTTYYLTTPSDAKDEMLWTLVGSGELGLAYGFSSPRSNLKFEFQVLYNGQVIYAVSGVGGGSDDNDLGDTQVNFGGVDIFHGPKAQLRLSF